MKPKCCEVECGGDVCSACGNCLTEHNEDPVNNCPKNPIHRTTANCQRLACEKGIAAKAYTACETYQKQIKELEAKLEKHRWIPVTERLPENVADVFILTGEGSVGIGIYGDMGENGYGWERHDYAISLNITHWKKIIF